MSSRKNWSFQHTAVGHSFAWSLALSLLPVAAAFAVSWIIARFSGPTVWGSVSWAMAFATQVLIVAKLGLDLGASRLASEYGVSKPGALRTLMSTGSNLRLALALPTSVLTYFLAPTVAGWFHNDALVWPVRISAGVIFCASIYEFQEQFLIGLNRHATVSRVRLVMLLVRVLATAGVVAAGLGVVALLLGYIAAWVVGIVAFWFLLRRFLPEAGPDDGDRAKIRRRLLAMSIPLAISSASVTIYSQMDKLVLGYFDPLEEVGQYSIARAVMEVSLFPAFAFVTTLRPALAARYSRGDMADCARLLRRSLRIALVAGVLFASVFVAMAVPLLSLVYSDQYRYAGELMAMFAWVVVIRSMGALVLPALLAADRIRTYAWLTAGAAVLNFGLNVVLIPRMHSRGAILATIISYGLLLLFGMREVFGIFGVRLNARALGQGIRTLLAGTLAATALWMIVRRIGSDSGLVTIALAAVHVILYGLMVVALRVVRPGDVRPLIGNLLKIKN
ncbi:MAG TPA: flippase [Candidatus Krumholzibacteria bacterium]|nr:flippase [Candidatus Krumholzibacteria bacterium]